MNEYTLVFTLEDKAYQFAQEKHKHQIRKFTNEPYVNHCKRVALMVKEACGTDYKPELVAAAYLHDCLEDTQTSYDELVKEFNKAIADIVLALTNDKEEMKKFGNGSNSKTEYLRQKIPNLTDDQLLIKLCDRYDNITDLKGPDDHWSCQYAEQTYKVFFDALSQKELQPIHLMFLARIRAKISTTIQMKYKDEL